MTAQWKQLEITWDAHTALSLRCDSCEVSWVSMTLTPCLWCRKSDNVVIKPGYSAAVRDCFIYDPSPVSLMEMLSEDVPVEDESRDEETDIPTPSCAVGEDVLH